MKRLLVQWYCFLKELYHSLDTLGLVANKIFPWRSAKQRPTELLKIC